MGGKPSLPVERPQLHALPEMDEAALLEQADQMQKELEGARADWTSALQALDRSIPHDDVMLDDRTMSYHVIRNLILSRLNALDELEDVIAGVRKTLGIQA